MGQRSGGIFKLPGHEAAGGGGKKLLRLFDRPLHPLRPGGENQPGAVCGQHGPPLGGHGVGHGEDDLVAPGGGHHGQADAGIARGGFDNGAAGRQLAPGLGVVNEGEGQPVLGGAGGVEVLQLGQHVPLPAVVRGQSGEAEQGGIAHQLLHAVVYS